MGFDGFLLGSLDSSLWEDQTMQIYGNFGWFVPHINLFGLVI